MVRIVPEIAALTGTLNYLKAAGAPGVASLTFRTPEKINEMLDAAEPHGTCLSLSALMWVSSDR